MVKFKILVVGASGFIGRHLSAFLANNREIDVVLASRNHHKGMLKIDDFDEIPLVDLVIHLGGSNNTDGNRRELFNTLSCEIRNAKKVTRRCGSAIYVSSAYVYRDNMHNPISIFGSLETKLPYSIYKQRLENTFLESQKAIVVRPSNIYGPGMSERTLFSKILNQAKTTKRVKVNNCSPVRDFLNVKEFVEGLSLLGISCLEQSLHDSIFNFGTGIGTSVRELCEIINLVGEFKYEIDCLSHDRHDPSYLVLDIGRTIEEIGWRPSVSLKRGLEVLINPNQR